MRLPTTKLSKEPLMLCAHTARGDSGFSHATDNDGYVCSTKKLTAHFQ